ncbi:MAG: serine/threonine-protein kinase [Microcoleaceae cyanobacterium]
MTQDNSQVMKGTCLSDRYEVVDHISIKAGRETLLAKDIQTQEVVIIKLIKFGTGIDWNQIKLFEREAQILKTLSHDYIPKYRDYFELNLSNIQGFALVQDYINAKSLEEQLQAGRRFTELEIKQLATAILKILIDLHSQKPSVIHRDIKPSNILVTNRSGNHVGDVYLVDFGSVQNLAENQGGTITIVGTYGYMPPEQFGGKASAASDLYSLGATLIYAATGIHPAEIPQKDLRLQFESMVDLSSGFIQWLKRMTEPSLDRRFLLAEDALKVLEKPALTAIKPILSQKPFYSKVWLFKSISGITLTIPNKRYKIEKKSRQSTIKFSLLLSSIIVVCLLYLFILQLFIGINAIPGIYTAGEVTFMTFIFLCMMAILTFPLVFSTVFLLSELFNFFNATKIKFNISNKQIKYYRYSFLYLPFLPTSSGKQIIKIEQTEPQVSHQQYKPQDQVNSQSPASLTMVTEDNQKYVIDYLTQAEVNWLGSELSHYLDIPLVKQKIQLMDESNNS